MTANIVSTHLWSSISQPFRIAAGFPTVMPSVSPPAHIRDAQQERQYLSQRLASHADNIMNRWKKKSRDKRQALLAETIPGLYEHRWLIPR